MKYLKYFEQKKEMWLAVLIILLYTFFAYFQLGNTKSIENFYRSSVGNTPATVEFNKTVDIKKIMVFLGPTADANLTFLYDQEGNTKQVQNIFNFAFTWNEYPCSVKTNSFRILLPVNCDIGEIAFMDSNNHVIPIKKVDAKYAKFFDEQSLVPTQRTYMNSFYFDEIYHGRTAYEFIHGLSIYEWTHPPLGKLIMTIGVRLFGPTPFGFRCVGTLFGIFMLPIMYLFAKRMFRSSKMGLICMTLLALDFMHYTQTRIATVDSYLTFFLLLSFYFMYRYITDDNLKATLIDFALSGIFWGLACCTKWNGFYAGIALFVIFIISLRDKLKNVFSDQKARYLIGIIATGVGCFLIIPAICYMLCFIPMVHGNPSQMFAQFISWQKQMYHYHSTLNATHPYSSPWWQWPLMLKPLFYYQQTFSNSVRAGLDAFGNPVVWWGGGIVAFFVCLFFAIKNRSKNEIFLVLGYGLSMLPWVFITRVTFIYHFFPLTIFCVLMLGVVLNRINSKILNRTVLAVALILFIMYYPIITGIPAPVWYVDRFLRWIPIAF